jgi:hypothetical protein
MASSTAHVDSVALKSLPEATGPWTHTSSQMWLAALRCLQVAWDTRRRRRMTGEREGEHPARAYGTTGGGFAEGEAKPEEFEHDKEVGSFAAGEEEPEKFGDDERLGSFARGQEETESSQNVKEGTFGPEEDEPAEP